MPYVPLGSQRSDSPRTPTLRQFIKAGGDVSRASRVKIIFKPGKVEAYGFVTEDEYRVSVDKDSELFDTIESQLAEWLSGDTCLCVSPDLSKPGAFELVMDTNEVMDWSGYDWGWKGEHQAHLKKTRSKKTPG